jgi:hypothetical protein
LFPILLLLVFITGCGQGTQEQSQSEPAPQSPTTEQSIPLRIPPVKDEQPSVQTPPVEIKPEGSPTLQAADTSKPSPEVPPETPQEAPDTPVEGAWMLGMVSMGELNTDTGKYDDAQGMGQVYTFKPDGTYTALVIFGDTIWLTGHYSVEGDVLILTDRTAEESKDGGKTWSAPEVLPDASAPFAAETDERGTYLLLGEEGATPPLVEKENALKYILQT